MKQISGGRFVTAIVLVLLATRSEALIVAATADDVCPPTADPCVIVDTVQAVNGTVLDFGSRSVVVDPGGQIDVGAGAVALRCGHLSLATGTATAINLRQGAGGTGGSLAVTCLRTCSGVAATTCTTDADCLGLGTCSLGSGAADLNGKIDGDANPSAQLVLEAAGDISVAQAISLSGTSSAGTGGHLGLSSRLGTLSISAAVDVSGGGLAEGGGVVLESMGTMIVTSAIDASGGDFDGGSIVMRSDSDTTVSANLRADSKNGEGFGGFIDIASGGNLAITGGSAGAPVLISADGSGANGFGGDGGEVSLIAGADVSIGEFVSIRARGAIPDGFGGDVLLEAGATLSLSGSIRADARGASGAAGFVDLNATDLSLAATASIDLTGGDGGGDLVAFGNDTIVVAGSINLSATSGGPTGSLTSVSGGPTTMSGSISLDGTPDPVGANLTVEACAFTLVGGARIDNAATNGTSRITGHGLITLEPGSTLRATGLGGTHAIIYANASLFPSIGGTASPDPQVLLDATLGACSSCAIAADCNDTNPCTDDVCDPGLGCSNTPNALPCDDGLVCTTGDVCSAGTCTGIVPMACDDGNLCTDDGCDDATGCVNSPNSLPCDDGLACSLVDTCSAGQCLGSVPTTCDDGNACTRDSCDDVAGCINQVGPIQSCFASENSKLGVKLSDLDAKDSIGWKWGRGDAFAHSDIGDPTTTTDYTLCVFDHSGSVAVLSTRLELPPSPEWQEKRKAKGWQYKSKLGEHDGIRKLSLKPNSQGKSRVKLSAKRSALPEPLPVSATAMFDSDPQVTVQLIANTNTCWSVDYDQAASNTPTRYKAARK